MILQEKTSIYSYEGFKEFMSRNLSGATAYNEEQITNIKLNTQRMKRIDKTFHPDEAIKELFRNATPATWVVIVEPWCGDGAQILPVLNKISEASQGKVKLKIILRDENPEIMDQYLTNGARAIPIVISMDPTTDNVLWSWGPRPTKIRELAEKFKQENPGFTHKDLVYNIHKWYAEDNGRSIIQDLATVQSRENLSHMM